MLPLGLPFAPAAVSPDWFDWPSLPDLFPTSFPGVKTSRDAFLVDTDLDRLRLRVADYFDPAVSHDEIARRHPGVMRSTRRFNAPAVRDALLKRGGPTESGFVRYAYRPFDNRWLYWEAETKLLDEKRSEYWPHVFAKNRWLSVVPRLRTEATEPQTAVTKHLASLHLNEWSASMFPAWLLEDALGTDGNSGQRRTNLSPAARRYLERLDLTVEDLFHHVLAVLHDPAYREANAGALRMEWPRIPLPRWAELSAPTPSGRGASGSAQSPGAEGGSRTAPTSEQAEQAEQAAQTLAATAARGRELAALLDPEIPVPGVTTGQLRPEIAAIAVPTTTHGHNMTGDDFALTAGWGHFGSGAAVMPGQGRVVERAYTQDERAALSAAVVPRHSREGREGGFTFQVQQMIPKHLGGGLVAEALAWRVVVGLHELGEPSGREAREIRSCGAGCGAGARWRSRCRPSARGRGGRRRRSGCRGRAAGGGGRTRCRCRR